MNFPSTKRNANWLTQAKGKQKEEERNEKKKKTAAALGEALFVPKEQHLPQMFPVPATSEIQRNSGNPGRVVGHRESEPPWAAWGGPHLALNKKLGISEQMELQF